MPDSLAVPRLGVHCRYAGNTSCILAFLGLRVWGESSFGRLTSLNGGFSKLGLILGVTITNDDNLNFGSVLVSPYVGKQPNSNQYKLQKI